MLSIGKLAAGPGAGRYYVDQVALGREDYYAGDGEAPGGWIGSGAASLQLSGEVGRDWAPLGTTAAQEGAEGVEEDSSEDDETPADAGVPESAPGRIRTCDLSLRRRALYPLSYGRWTASPA
jgi:TrwC relaxase